MASLSSSRGIVFLALLSALFCLGVSTVLADGGYTSTTTIAPSTFAVEETDTSDESSEGTPAAANNAAARSFFRNRKRTTHRLVGKDGSTTTTTKTEVSTGDGSRKDTTTSTVTKKAPASPTGKVQTSAVSDTKVEAVNPDGSTTTLASTRDTEESLEEDPTAKMMQNLVSQLGDGSLEGLLGGKGLGNMDEMMRGMQEMLKGMGGLPSIASFVEEFARENNIKGLEDLRNPEKLSNIAKKLGDSKVGEMVKNMNLDDFANNPEMSKMMNTLQDAGIDPTKIEEVAGAVEHMLPKDANGDPLPVPDMSALSEMLKNVDLSKIEEMTKQMGISDLSKLVEGEGLGDLSKLVANLQDGGPVGEEAPFKVSTKDDNDCSIWMTWKADHDPTFVNISIDRVKRIITVEYEYQRETADEYKKIGHNTTMLLSDHCLITPNLAKAKVGAFWMIKRGETETVTVVQMPTVDDGYRMEKYLLFPKGTTAKTMADPTFDLPFDLTPAKKCMMELTCEPAVFSKDTSIDEVVAKNGDVPSSGDDHNIVLLEEPWNDDL